MTRKLPGRTSSSPPPVDWRARSSKSWRARKAAMCSRGEVSGPRIEACDAALSFHRLRAFLTRDMAVAEQKADMLIDDLLACGEVAR